MSGQFLGQLGVVVGSPLLNTYSGLHTELGTTYLLYWIFHSEPCFLVE